MKVVFLGTSQFACPSLEAIAGRSGHEIALVVTQPDRPAGRGHRLCAPPVKELAQLFDLPVCQPDRVNAKDTVARVAATRLDVLVVAAFGQLLRPPLLSAAPAGAFNLHGSLLPSLRGAAPVNWAIIRGASRTGVTTFLLDEGMDTGDVLLMAQTPIGPDETAGELEERLAEMGARLVLETLDGLSQGSLTGTPQRHADATLAPKLAREDGCIDWERPAETIHNRVRGTNPRPGAYSTLGGERVKIHRSRRTGIGRGALRPGTVALGETGRFLVATADELLELVEVQRPCRHVTSGSECLRGLRGEQCFTPP